MLIAMVKMYYKEAYILYMNLHSSTEDHYDYMELVYDEIGPFNDTSRHHCFDIHITDDLTPEGAENFMVLLDRDANTTGVSVYPNTTHITIIDNDSELSSISNK